MGKKPGLELIASSPDPLAPPADLGATGADLWRSITSEYDIEDSGGREMLAQICKAASMADEYAAIIAADGPVVRMKGGGMRDHPLLKHELAARSFVVRSLHRLGLDIEPTRTSVGRPPGSFNRTK